MIHTSTLRRFFIFLLAAALIASLGMTAFAEGTAPSHTLTVTDAEGNAPVFEGTVWKIDGGAYTVSGTAQSSEGLSVSGDVTLTLNNAAIHRTTADIAQYAPAIHIASGSSVTLILVGENAVTGSAGYAGISVAEGASLTISGDGSLSARGGDGYSKVTSLPADVFGAGKRGYWGGGAGIGGNGIWAYSDDTQIEGHAPSFGTIQIESGTVTAQGGDMCKANVGGGAGIGSGGTSGNGNTAYTVSGTVIVNGGSINAIGGGSQDASLTGGGAGIGAGGVTGFYNVPYNAVAVSIHGGAVTARGQADGAGIGGGANVDGGVITITGGLVNATGGYEIEDGVQYGGYGGAGIGGGDNGGLTSISISGGTVVARAGGCAAGIGSGSDRGVAAGDPASGEYVPGSISISGNANVTAYGGSLANSDEEGGAGIGAGRSHYFDNGCGSILIAGSATVRAYSGANAQAIGVGSNYAGQDLNSLTIADTVTLWAQNRGVSDLPALLNTTQEGSSPITYDSTGTYLVSSGSEAGIAAGYLHLPGEDSRTFSYSLSDTGLIIGGTPIPAALPQGTVGNWATLYKVPAITVSYQYVGTAPEGAAVPSSDTIDPGTSYTATQPEAVDGYRFDGWYTDEACTVKFEDGAVLDTDTVLYGRWLPEVTPIVPQTAVYRVEHYLKQPDGSYQLHETEFPLYGEIGTTVEATVKTYEGCHVNSGLSTLTGEVVLPTQVDGEVSYLVLKVYYDPDPVVDPPPTDPAPTDPSDIPETGDGSNPALWTVLLLLAACGVVGTVLYAGKRKAR